MNKIFNANQTPKVVQNPLKTKVLNEFAQNEDQALADKNEAQQEYDVAYGHYQQLCQQKESIYTQLKYDKGNGDLNKKYRAVKSSVFGAETNWGCAKDHLLGSLKQYKNAYTTTFIANTTLA